MLHRLLAHLSPAGQRARLSVLIFHRVLARTDPLFPQEANGARFDAICGWLRAWFNVVPLDDAVSRLRCGTLPERALAITFDDGYADNHDVALPILLRHGLAATFFVSTGFMNGGRMWNDSVIESVRRTSHHILDLRSAGDNLLGCYSVRTVEEKRAAIEAIIGRIKYLPPSIRCDIVGKISEYAGAALPGDLMLTSQHVLALRRAGMQIGAHTVTHPILAQLDRESAHREIAESKRWLEALLGERVGLFAYPNGKPGDDFNDQTAETVRAVGFDAAVSTAWGAAHQGTDLFQIPRFTPWDRSRLRFGARLMRNLYSSRT